MLELTCQHCDKKVQPSNYRVVYDDLTYYFCSSVCHTYWLEIHKKDIAEYSISLYTAVVDDFCHTCFKTVLNPKVRGWFATYNCLYYTFCDNKCRDEFSRKFK